METSIPGSQGLYKSNRQSNPELENVNGDLIMPANTEHISFGSQVPHKIKSRLISLHNKHSVVFNDDLNEGYNDQSGDAVADWDWVNDVPTPPHKGTIPSYCKHSKKMVLQADKPAGAIRNSKEGYKHEPQVCFAMHATEQTSL